MDAKSLYDHLSKHTVGGQDKRTAVEIQIIRQDLRELGGEVKWVDRQAMRGDGLTKVLGSNAALYELIRTGNFSARLKNRCRGEQMHAVQGNPAPRLDGLGSKKIAGSVKLVTILEIPTHALMSC